MINLMVKLFEAISKFTGLNKSEFKISGYAMRPKSQKRLYFRKYLKSTSRLAFNINLFLFV